MLKFLNVGRSMKIPANYGKPHAAQIVIERAGITGVNYWGFDVGDVLKEVSASGDKPSNGWLETIAEPLEGPLSVQMCHLPEQRSIGRPIYLNGRPDYYGDFEGDWPTHETPYGYVEIEEGYFAAAPDIPVFFDTQKRLLDYVGSKYKHLLYYYDFNLHEMLQTAPYLNETLIVIIDDVWDLNYCHWLSDWLPRLEICKKLWPNEKIKVATNKIIAPFQRESLHLLGFSDEDIVPFERMSAVRVKRLIVPNDLAHANHPAHKGAPWALNYLKSNILNQDTTDQTSYPENIYISRNDAGGRRMVNEAKFVHEIEKLGFKTIVLSNYSFIEQAKLFENAKNIIGLHGAGLTNIVFSKPGTRLLELTPKSYGMPSFFILSGAQNMPYATFLCDVVPGERTQLDDMVVNVPEVMREISAFFAIHEAVPEDN